ncbi:MAG TPA: hypothetical protein VHX14_14320 [Thermoanaerobaculia bacterium]|nr:hypothetical protein [Thermoanaerobaculia bacterium]
MSAIFENALDSLKMGVSHLVDDRLQTSDKWAILELFHTIELLLKERLYRENPLFIYKQIDQAVGDDSITVGLRDILVRFENLKISIPPDYRRMLLDLQRRRNRIEHHRFDEDQEHRTVLGEALKFINYFLTEHLGDDLEQRLTSALFRQAKELIFEYEELLRKAEESMKAAMGRHSYKEQMQLETAQCPECGNETVLIGDEPRVFCHYCHAEMALMFCGECANWLPPEELLRDYGICRECYDYKLKHD